VSVNCFTTGIYIVIVGVMMCCECCFTTVICNVMTIALSLVVCTYGTHNPSLLKFDKEAVEGIILCFNI
jgi:uncharacterized membrane protein YccF (DUF307 family)